MKIYVGLAALALAAGCGGSDENSLSAQENQALNEAAAMLDAPIEPAETGEALVIDNAATDTD